MRYIMLNEEEKSNFFNLIADLRLNKNPEVIVAVKKEKQINVYKDFMKKERTEKENRDFVEKSKLLELFLKYSKLENIKSFGVGLSETETKQYKALKKEMAKSYYSIARKLLNHRHFRNYNTDMKNDLVQNAMLGALNIGKEGRNNYGVEYWIRFDINKSVNIFAFWTQQIKMFFYMALKIEYSQKNISWSNMQDMVDQFDYDAKYVHGMPHAKFNFASVIDDANDE